MYLTSTAASHLLGGLSRTLPIDMTDPAKFADWSCRPGDYFLVTLCFDAASSNLAAVRQIAHAIQAARGLVLFHGERCATHCIHLVKARCIVASSSAGMLYSVSKLLGHNRVVDELCRGIAAHLRANLDCRHGPAPPNDDLRDAMVQMLGVDDESSLMGRDFGSAKRPTAWFSDVLSMIQHCCFEPSAGRWVCYMGHDERLGQPGLESNAVDYILQPLLKVFVYRRWERAALFPLDRRDEMPEGWLQG